MKKEVSHSLNGFTARLAEKRVAGQRVTYIAEVMTPTGKRQRFSLYTADPKAVSDVFRDWCQAVMPKLVDSLGDTAEKAHDEDVKLRVVIEYYVETYLPNKNAPAKTLQKADQVLYEFLRFCAGRNTGRVSQLTPSLVDAWIADLREKSGLAPKTLKTRIIMLRACLNAAVDRELIGKSPIRKWLFPTVPDSEIWPLTIKQLTAVLEIIAQEAPEVAAVTCWMALTGNRPSDTLALRWRQIDVAQAVVNRAQVKTSKLTRYELAPEAVAVLEHEQERGVSDDIVFTDARGNPMSTSKVYHDFTRAIERAGFERRVNLKDLRHTFGSLMANEHKCPLPVLQRLMGHTDIKTTMRYIRPSDGTEYVRAFAAKITEQNGTKPLKILARLGTGSKKASKIA